MNTKYVTNSESIENTKSNLYEKLPRSRKIEVIIDRSPTRKFRTKIIVNLPEKQIVAKKSANTYLHSLEKAEQAILKQAGRLNQKKARKSNTIKKKFLDFKTQGEIYENRYS